MPAGSNRARSPADSAATGAGSGWNTPQRAFASALARTSVACPATPAIAARTSSSSGASTQSSPPAQS